MSRINPPRQEISRLRLSRAGLGWVRKPGPWCFGFLVLVMGFSSAQLMKGRGELPVATGQPAAAKLPADVDAAKRKFETATFGMGWFWGPDSRFGNLPGVLRTRVGYAGGTKDKPTYRSMGDHTEAIAIDFDPSVISYEDLLGYFFRGHNCAVNFGGRQYMNAVFYHDDKQKKLAGKALEKAARDRGLQLKDVKTGIFPVTEFTYAEEYHQKYALTRHPQLREFLRATYPGPKALADSTAATRLNAWLGGGFNEDQEALMAELESFGLPDKLRQYVLSSLKMR